MRLFLMRKSKDVGRKNFMKKKLLIFSLFLIMLMSLCGCGANVNFEKSGNDIKTTIEIDNSQLGISESDKALFEANGFSLEMGGNTALIKTVISYNDFDADFSKKVSFLKQILAEINPSLKSQIEGIEVEGKRTMHGYSFSGVNELAFSISGLEDINVNLRGTSDLMVSMDAQDYQPGETVAGTITQPEYSFDFIDNSNIDSVKINTNISKDRITSKISVSLKNKIDQQTAETTLSRAGITDVTVAANNVSFMIEYSSPEMFSALHSSDLYNCFGGTYLISLDGSGIYSQKGSLDIRSASNGGIEKVYYSVTANGKSVQNEINLEDGKVYNIPYSSTDTSGIIVTIIVLVSIGLVVGGFIYMAKKRN